MSDSWKKWFWRSAGFGAGLAIGLCTIVSVWIWYSSRPTLPAPWNKHAIVATYHSVQAVDGHKLEFSYVLENKTDKDYRLTKDSEPSIAGKLEDTDSLTGFGSGSIVLSLPIYIPAKNKALVSIETPDYGFVGAPLDSAATTNARHIAYRAVVKHVSENMANLNGFVLFDDPSRYEVDFPSGWKDDFKHFAKDEQLSPPKGR